MARAIEGVSALKAGRGIVISSIRFATVACGIN